MIWLSLEYDLAIVDILCCRQLGVGGWFELGNLVVWPSNIMLLFQLCMWVPNSRTECYSCWFAVSLASVFGVGSGFDGRVLWHFRLVVGCIRVGFCHWGGKWCLWCWGVRGKGVCIVVDTTAPKL